MYRRKCRRWAFHPAELASNDLYLAAIWQSDATHLGICDRLIFWRGHLVLCRQVDPELDHLKRTAVAVVFLLVKFFVQQPAAGGHPLDIAFFNNAAAADR